MVMGAANALSEDGAQFVREWVGDNMSSFGMETLAESFESSKSIMALQPFSRVATLSWKNDE